MKKASLAKVGIALIVSALLGRCMRSDTPAPINQNPVTLPPAKTDPPFDKARAIFTERCSECHYGFPEMTEEEWVSEGYVVGKAPERSLVFRKIRGSGVGGPQDMPPSVSQSLTADEVSAIRAWIESLPEPAPQGAEGRMALALGVIKGRCAGCHDKPVTATSSQFAGVTIPAFARFEKEGEFVTSGVVIMNDSKASILIRALKQFGDLNLMPPKSAISEQEFGDLQNWIDLLGEP